jgi:hypothetical protein
MQRDTRAVVYAFIFQYIALTAIGLYAVSLNPRTCIPPPQPPQGDGYVDLDAATAYALIGRARLFAREGMVEIVNERVDDKGRYEVFYKTEDGYLTRWEVTLR